MANESKRFWASIIRKTGGCWEWQGPTCGTNNNYGRFHSHGKKIMAHRFAYMELVGDIPNGYEIDHLCRNPSCVNPNHLEVVTRRENILRGLLPEIMRQRQLDKTHCPKGHPYDETNTYITPRGKRDCRLCHIEALRRYREK